MSPPSVNNGHELADAVGSWDREEMELRKLDPLSQDLPECYRMIALKCLLSGRITEHVELNSASTTTYPEMRETIMTWAMQKKLERRFGNNPES